MPEETGTTPVFNGNMDDLFEDFVDEPENTEAPTQETPEAPEEQGQPQAETSETAPETQEPEAPEAEAPAEEQPQLIGGKFKTTEDVLTAFQQAERLATQRAQEAAATRRQYEDLMTRLRQAEPMLRQAAAMQQQPNLDELDTSDPQVIQQLIDQRAAQIAQAQIAQQLAPVQEQFEAQQEVARQETLKQFRTDFPESRDFDGQILSLFEQWQRDEGNNPDPNAFPPTPDNLRIALKLAQNPKANALLDDLEFHPDRAPEWVDRAIEATSNPQLEQIVRAFPRALEDEHAMTWVRQQAGLPAVVQQAQQNAQQAQTQSQEAERKAAFVEKGEGNEGDLAPGRKPQDPLEEALQDALEGDAKGAIFR